jgi:hypothetical protein
VDSSGVRNELPAMVESLWLVPGLEMLHRGMRLDPRTDPSASRDVVGIRPLGAETDLQPSDRFPPFLPDPPMREREPPSACGGYDPSLRGASAAEVWPSTVDLDRIQGQFAVPATPNRPGPGSPPLRTQTGPGQPLQAGRA